MFVKRFYVKGDGFCLIRAFLDDDSNVNLEEVKDKIKNELKEEQNQFSDYLQAGWVTEMKAYLERRVWNSNFVDTLPAILSALYDTDLIVLKFEGNNYIDGYRFNEGGRRQAVIGQFKDHYWRIKTTPSKEKKEKSNYKRSTAVLPFINDSVSIKVRRVIKDLKIDCNFSFKSDKLYAYCDSQRYRNIEGSDMDKKGVIYKITCKECAKTGEQVSYIGETGRRLGVRVKEHLRKYSNKERWSEVCKHSVEKHGGNDIRWWEVVILEHEDREFHRIAKEAEWISRETCCLNKVKGLQIFGK